jgi:5-methylcytosine-specific restriction endonuclease McrA
MHRKESRFEINHRLNIKDFLFNERGMKCEQCGSIDSLTIHHKKLVSEYPELEYDNDNLLILCENCHRKIHQGIGVKH